MEIRSYGVVTQSPANTGSASTLPSSDSARGSQLKVPETWLPCFSRSLFLGKTGGRLPQTRNPEPLYAVMCMGKKK